MILIRSESDRITIQLANCRGHMQELGQNGLGCSMQVGWLGFEHPIQEEEGSAQRACNTPALSHFASNPPCPRRQKVALPPARRTSKTCMHILTPTKRRCGEKVNAVSSSVSPASSPSSGTFLGAPADAKRTLFSAHPAVFATPCSCCRVCQTSSPLFVQQRRDKLPQTV